MLRVCVCEKQRGVPLYEKVYTSQGDMSIAGIGRMMQVLIQLSRDLSDGSGTCEALFDKQDAQVYTSTRHRPSRSIGGQFGMQSTAHTRHTHAHTNSHSLVPPTGTPQSQAQFASSSSTASSSSIPALQLQQYGSDSGGSSSGTSIHPTPQYPHHHQHQPQRRVSQHNRTHSNVPMTTPRYVPPDPLAFVCTQGQQVLVGVFHDYLDGSKDMPVIAGVVARQFEHSMAHVLREKDEQIQLIGDENTETPPGAETEVLSAFTPFDDVMREIAREHQLMPSGASV